jgi:organic radical activating enzyme
MRVCCTSNSSSVQDPDSNTKVGGGRVGVIKNDRGHPSNLNTTSLKEAWNSDYMRNIRKHMINEEKPDSCIKCYKEEDAGVHSKRNWENKHWADYYNFENVVAETHEDGTVPMKISYFDLRMGTKCQLACVMCSPHDSSGWVKEHNKIFPDIKNESLKNSFSWSNKGQVHGATYNWYKNNDQFWNELNQQIPHFHQLYFAGGEPLIIKEHYQLLEDCIKNGTAKNILLRYNSNGIEWREDLFDLWKHFKKVKFHYSIDAHGKHNDYIRYPSQWQHQEEVFWKLDETPNNVEVTVATTIMLLNIGYIPEFVKWKVRQEFKKINKWPLGAGGINMHFAYWPPQLNIKVLPKDIKQQITNKYENEFYPWIEDNWDKFTGVKEANIDKQTFMKSEYGIKRYKGLINFMHSEDWSVRLPETKEYLQLINKSRGFENSFEHDFALIKDILK